jgi:hypothetical protein
MKAKRSKGERPVSEWLSGPLMSLTKTEERDR